MFYPNELYDAIEKIDIQELLKKNIQGMILDVDNTLIDYNRILSNEVINWVKNVKEAGIKVYILSNTIKKRKVEDVSKKLDIPYIMFAKKPSKKGFLECIGKLDMKPENICVIGDQIFTDILGGNRMGMYTIYTKPINKKDCSITTTIKRPFEKIILKKYVQKKGDK